MKCALLLVFSLASHFLTFGYLLWTPDNSNFFRFPLKVRVIRGVDCTRPCEPSSFNSSHANTLPVRTAAKFPAKLEELWLKQTPAIKDSVLRTWGHIFRSRQHNSFVRLLNMKDNMQHLATLVKSQPLCSKSSGKYFIFKKHQSLAIFFRYSMKNIYLLVHLYINK